LEDDADIAVVVLAPLGGDAGAIGRILDDLGYAHVSCDRPDSFIREIEARAPDRVLFGVITHEGATREVGERLRTFYGSEDIWSHLPMVFLLARHAGMPPAANLLLADMGEPPLVLLNRPVSARALRGVFSVQSQMRRRQLEIRNLLERVKSQERHKDFLLHEVYHRTRNSFSVLQSLFRMTAARHTDLNGFTEDFSQRFASLVSAHTRLAQEAPQQHDLDRLIHEHAAPYCITEEQVQVEGPRIELESKTSFELALIVHELATNASKYGALSQPEGRVAVSWRREAGNGGLNLEWKERGGPAVSAPGGSGLGTRLIEGAGGSIDASHVAFEEDGVVWRCSLRADTFRFPKEEAG